MFKCEEVKLLTNRNQRAKSRIYIFPKGESILEHLFGGRQTRPYTHYRKEVLPGVLASLGVRAEDVKVRWSKYAGCSCPCSPGFIVEDGSWRLGYKDVSISVSAS